MDIVTIGHAVTPVLSSWYEAKMVVERAGAISTDALHVIVGVLVQLLAALLFRRPLASWAPWLAVLLALIFNEAVDLWGEQWPSLAMQLAEGGKDLVVTMFLPTMLMLALRLSPSLR
jgi:hypothetical protein